MVWKSHDLGVSQMERLALLPLVVWEQEDTIVEPLHWEQEVHIWILDTELIEQEVTHALLHLPQSHSLVMSNS